MAGRLLLSVQNGIVRYGAKTLFDGLDFSIREGEKLCLIGKNGAGKSTLMNIITGARGLDEGTLWRMAGVSVGYLQQDVVPKPLETVRDFIFAALDNQDGSHDYKIEKIIEPLELDPAALTVDLSGGQLRRAALARALVEEPDILLLDEPTNHLDLDIIAWLENYVKSCRCAVICVSHDKAFLAHVSEKVFWLDRGQLKICPKGFGFFEEWSAMILDQEARELHNRQKALEIEAEWASRGVKARRKRNVRRVELMKEERARLRTDRNALDRMLAKINYAPGELAEATSRLAVEFHNVAKSYGATGDDRAGRVILDQFNLRIMRGDRIGVIGRNGSGKTSFLKLLVGETKPDMGKVKVAHDLTASYFDQTRQSLIPDHTLQQVLCPGGGDHIEVQGKPRHIRGYLKDFLFDPQMADHPVSTLSGGQKNRLMLAKIMANPGGLLILDEPTNDLDMDTLDMLEDMLSAYTGTLIVVSHDRDFLDQTISKILAFEGDGKIVGVVGGYQDYLARRSVNAPAAPAKGKPKASRADDAVTPAARLTYIQTFELEQLPQKIAGYEAAIATCEAALADGDLYSRDPARFERISRQLADSRAALHQAEERWLDLESRRLAIISV